MTDGPKPDFPPSPAGSNFDTDKPASASSTPSSSDFLSPASTVEPAGVPAATSSFPEASVVAPAQSNAAFSDIKAPLPEGSSTTLTSSDSPKPVENDVSFEQKMIGAQEIMNETNELTTRIRRLRDKVARWIASREDSGESSTESSGLRVTNEDLMAATAPQNTEVSPKSDLDEALYKATSASATGTTSVAPPTGNPFATPTETSSTILSETDTTSGEVNSWSNTGSEGATTASTAVLPSVEPLVPHEGSALVEMPTPENIEPVSQGTSSASQAFSPSEVSKPGSEPTTSEHHRGILERFGGLFGGVPSSDRQTTTQPGATLKSNDPVPNPPTPDVKPQ